MPVDRNELYKLDKGELVECLVLAITGQEATTKNMQSMAELLKLADEKIKELTAKNQTQEAELIALRNRP